MRKLLLAALAATALICPRPASADLSPNSVDFATLSAVCASPTTGCATGQAVSARVNGRNSVVVQIVDAAFNATVAPYVSTDNGANWKAANLAAVANVVSGLQSSVAVNDSSINVYAIPLASNATDVMLAVTAYTSGTALASILISNTNPSTLPFLISSKNAQPLNSRALGTQDLKDAGRTFVVLGADGITPAIAETVITVSQNKAGTVTGGVTTYAITASKTLRLQNFACSFTAGATANRVRVALRLNTGGACVAGSGLLMPAMELSPPYGTATAGEGGAYGEIPFPDGLELTGTSWNICLSESATAAAGTLTCTLTGYEY
jgi:hypothetical protein